MLNMGNEFQMLEEIKVFWSRFKFFGAGALLDEEILPIYDAYVRMLMRRLRRNPTHYIAAGYLSTYSKIYN